MNGGFAKVRRAGSSHLGFRTGSLEEVDEEVDAFADFGGFEETLAVVGVVDELLGDGVGGGGGVAGFVEGGVDLLVDLGGEIGEGAVEGAAETVEEFFFFGSGEGGVEDGADAGVGVWFFVVPFIEVNAEDAVEEEIGGAFFGFARGADEADRADGGG